MTRDVEKVDQSDMALSRRDLMGSSAVVAAGALGVGMVGTAAAQDGPTDEISGLVEDTDGNAVDGATVVAVPHDESLDALQTTTDANGEYLFGSGDLHTGEELYHVVARDGTEADPFRSQQNYPFIAAVGETAIPDSVIHRWQYDEGSGTTAADSIGTADATINGPSWTSGTWQGGNALDGDGTDDYVDHTTLGTFGSSMADGFAIGVTVQTTNTGAFGTINSDGTQDNRIHFGNGAEYSTSVGTIFFTLIDDSGNAVTLESNSSVDDGEQHRWLLNATDPTSDSLEIHIDAVNDSGAYQNQDSPSNFIDFNESFFAFALNTGGSGTQFLDGIVDDIIIYDSPLSSSEVQQDYNSQPWT